MKMLLPQQVIHHRVPEGATCLSLYANSSTELEQLVEQARRSARNELSAPEVERLFRPLRRWRFDADSGAFPTGIFISQGFSGCAHLPFKSKGLGVVAKSFHVKPLLKWIQR